MSTTNPNAQPRNQHGRDWGNYSSPTVLPNCSGWVGADTTNLEVGDTAYVTTTTPGRYHCQSAGTPGALDAVWIRTGEIPPQTVIYDMPIDVASVGTPVFIRDELNNPLAPGSTAAASVVDIQAAPALTAKALRLELSGGVDAGGWIFPVNCGPLPDEGFVVEVWYSGIDSGNRGGFVMPLADFTTTPTTVEGLGGTIFSQLYGAMPEIDILTATYARFILGPTPTGWPTSPVQAFANKGPFVQRIEVRRAQATTPATWQFKQMLEGPDGSYVVSASVSGVSNALPSLDGKTFTQIGIGPFVPLGYAPPAYIDIQRLRVLSLG